MHESPCWVSQGAASYRLSVDRDELKADSWRLVAISLENATGLYFQNCRVGLARIVLLG
jgi:hypothetical protein